MTFLLDVNVWLALVVAEHTHASRARDWAESAKNDEFALCRVTQMGLLRLLTNRHVMGEDVLPEDGAWRAFDRLISEPNIFFAAEPPALDRMWRGLTPSHSGSNFWTDTYLAAFAQVSGYTLVTFDRGFSRYKNLRLKIPGVAGP